MSQQGALPGAHMSREWVPGPLRPASEQEGPHRAAVLLELGQHGPLSVPDLAARCQLDDDVVAEQLGVLQVAGYARTDGDTWEAVSLVERHHARAYATTRS